jgi:hypothetical protein
MQQYAATIFLPRSDRVFGLYPHLLEEVHLAKCTVLRAKDFTAFYPVGWFNDRQGDLVEIYYVISRLAELHAFCVRVSFISPGDLQVVAFDWLPAGLQPPDELDLSRYGRSLRKDRFLPRILPVRSVAASERKDRP